MIAAFAMKIVGCGSSDIAKALGCTSTPTVGPRVRFGQWFRKLVEPGKVYCIAMRIEELFFSRDMPILKCINRNVEPSLQIPPCLEWNDASLLV